MRGFEGAVRIPAVLVIILSCIHGFSISPGSRPTFHRSLQMSTSADQLETPLSVTNRIGRALSFYSAAIPVFAAYSSLGESIKFQRHFNDHAVSKEEEEAQYVKLHEWGSEIITEKIKELKGFYVKTGQIISTRVDIFPSQYTSKLAIMQDDLDPLPGDVIKEIVKRDLLNGAELSELFAEFDDQPLGAASIAQVHKAKLLDGRVVAVKVQRPGVEPKLLGDIANLKNFAQIVSEALPIDYYKVFCELERTLIYELDFLHEAQASAKVAAAVAHSPRNKPRKSPVTVPLPIPGLVSRRVMVMEFVEGVALSKIAAEMQKRGVEKGSPESLLLGKKLLTALTDAYSSMIFGSGIIHGDPHPGNIFIMNGGEVALLDCGQVKQLTTAQRLDLARLIVMVNDWEGLYNKNARERESGKPAALTVGEEPTEVVLRMKTKEIADAVRGFGVTFKDGVGDDCAAAVAILLFGNTDTKLPGGYAGEEISVDSPIVQVSEFPQELVLLGRATVMIKGIANRLGLSWGLSDRWAAEAREAIASIDTPAEMLPIWSVVPPTVATTDASASGASSVRLVAGKDRIRFADVWKSFTGFAKLLRSYVVSKVTALVRKYVPEATLRKVLRFALRVSAVLKGETIESSSSV